jgi:hypothetical protein
MSVVAARLFLDGPPVHVVGAILERSARAHHDDLAEVCRVL